MMEKLSDNDIHHILDHYGQSSLQLMNAQDLEGMRSKKLCISYL